MKEAEHLGQGEGQSLNSTVTPEIHPKPKTRDFKIFTKKKKPSTFKAK